MTAPDPGLFEVITGQTNYKPQPTFVLPDDVPGRDQHGVLGGADDGVLGGADYDHRRGPGAAPPTRPEDARAPSWWKAEAERVVLQLAAEQGRVTADDLHRWYGHEPSASGAAIGQLFRKLAKQQKLTLIGYEPSTRAARRGAVTGIWRLTEADSG